MDEETIEYIEGTVLSVIFRNEENGYTIVSARISGYDDKKTVVGTFPYLVQGELFSALGVWTEHKQYGEQFTAESLKTALPTSASDIFDFISGGFIKGVGPATASLIVNEFGEESLKIIENFPEKLTSVKGISRKKAQQISDDFKKQVGIGRMISGLCDYGIEYSHALRMYKYYGDNALRVLEGNPYVICANHIGGSFAAADSVALALGFEEYSQQRIEAAILFELAHNCENGHCFIPDDRLATATCELIGVDEDRVTPCLENLISDGRIICDCIKNIKACYLPELYDAETTVASHLASMANSRMSSEGKTAFIFDEITSETGIEISADIARIMELAVSEQVLVITGGPGTGKTTSINVVLKLYDKLGIRSLIAAPTGRAAKRITEVTGRPAATVHRLLEANVSEDGLHNVFGRDEDNPLDCDAVILDECSMVDITLMSALLKAVPENARLIMVGDADQLPPVGPGLMFRSVIESGVIPSVRLTHIYRQNSGSRIVSCAHQINSGEYPDFGANRDGLFRLKRIQAASSVETILELFSSRLPGKMNIPASDIQVLSPTRKGELGTVYLNARLQEVLNPASDGKREHLYGERIFREKDRVMQIRNNYDLVWIDKETGEDGIGIYNGDMGQIVEIDEQSEKITVDFDGRITFYPFEAVKDLEHSWAVTVHKSQGSEYRAVIFVLNPASRMLLTRDLLYTGVTRAKEILIMVGEDQVAYSMIDNFKRRNRYSFLKTRLTELVNG